MKFIRKLFLLSMFSVLMSSCVEDLDFEQAETITLSPAVELSLIYFSEPAPTFVNDDGSEEATITDAVELDVFTEQFTIDNLIKAEFLFEATNSINRSFTAQVDFYNDNGDLQHTINFDVPASEDNLDLVVEHLEVFEGVSLEALKATTQIDFSTTLNASSDGSVLDDTSPGNFMFRSMGTFFFLINTSE